MTDYKNTTTQVIQPVKKRSRVTAVIVALFIATFSTTAYAGNSPPSNPVANAFFTLGNIAAAELRWHDAATHYTNAARLHPSFEYNLKASEYLWRTGDYEGAIDIDHSNLKLAAEEFGKNHVNYGTALNNLALSLQAMGHYAGAEPLMREALKNAETALGKDHASYGIRLNNLALLLKATGRYEGAEPLFREALKIPKTHWGKIMHNMAVA